MIRVTVVEGAIRVSEQPLNSPLLFKLNANYPNPFNSATEISFEIPYSGQVSLKIYDIAGRLVDIVYEGNLSAGRHKFRFFGNGLSSGVYLMELKQEDNKSMKKIVLVK
jgi:hypothetical protein